MIPFAFALLNFCTAYFLHFFLYTSCLIGNEDRVTAIKTDGEGTDDLLVASLTTLCASYNKCLTALSRLRSGHMSLVHEYIIAQQKQVAASSTGGSIEKNAGGKGTGGTDLMHFLKPMRDNCNSAKVLKGSALYAAESNDNSI